MLRIGEAAGVSGFPVRTIRYYEKRGLLEPAARSEAGYRLYGSEELELLKFIGRAKLMGLTLKEIGVLIRLAAECRGGDLISRMEDILESRLRETRRKLEQLAALQGDLLYYQSRLSEVDAPRDCGCAWRGGFCGRLEVVARETARVNESMEEVRQIGLPPLERTHSPYATLASSILSSSKSAGLL